MNFNAPLLKPIRILLFPFSLVFALFVWLRNRLYDRKIIQSSTFNLPLICVGNLSIGGTGKSPMVEYLIAQLKDDFEVAVLSRGYKRKTRGYALADSLSTALDIGDEPMLFYNKFPDVSIAVGEERIVAIPQLLHDRPNTHVVILDDAFQHRSIQCGLNILLTDYNNLFTRDWFLPTGDLRDEQSSYKRADILIVTKCRPDMRYDERDQLHKELRPLKHQQLFFSTIYYDTPYHIISRERLKIDDSLEILLVSGIANPRPLKKYLLDNSKTYYELLYSDHHIFTIDDLREILKRFENVTDSKKIILTTEKDAVRLIKFQQELAHTPFYVIPIQMRFLFNDQHRFNNLITTFIKNFRSKN